MVKVGVLALQGDVREHGHALTRCGVEPVEVRTTGELFDVDALILPGGESTTIGKLLERFGLLQPLRERATSGMPLYGTCAGAILMATEVIGPDPAPHRIDVLDIGIERNAYGRQRESFEADVRIRGTAEPFRGVFIRAPSIEKVGPDVEVVAELDGRPVAVRQGRFFASTFHPELTDDTRLHEMFVGMIGDD